LVDLSDAYTAALSRECGTFKKATARFWPWLSGKTSRGAGGTIEGLPPTLPAGAGSIKASRALSLSLSLSLNFLRG